MTKKVFNMAGGLHSAAAYAAFENRMFGGNCKASVDSFIVSAGTGMNASISAGDGLIRVDTTLARRIQSDAVESVAIAAASTSYGRIDYVVAYIDNAVATTTSVVDNTNGVLKFASIAGTAAATPVAPTAGAIQAAIGAGNPYMILASVLIPQNATNLSAASFTQMAQTAAQASTPMAQYSEIINSQCRIGQRGTASLSTTYRYGKVDRFAVKATGTAVTSGVIDGATTSSVSNSGYALRVSSATISGTGKLFVRYRMESKDAMRFKNATTSFAVRVLHDVGATISYLIRVSKPTVADNFGTVTEVANSGTIGVATGVPTQIKFENINNGTIGDVSNGIEFEIEIATGSISSKTFDFSEFQFNIGAVVNPNYLPRQMADELAACQRYFEKSFKIETTPANNVELLYANGSSPTGMGGVFNEQFFRVTKRTAPTVVIYGSSGNSFDFFDGAWQTGTTTAGNISEVKFTPIISRSSGQSGYNDEKPRIMRGNWTADSEL